MSFMYLLFIYLFIYFLLLIYLIMVWPKGLFYEIFQDHKQLDILWDNADIVYVSWEPISQLFPWIYCRVSSCLLGICFNKQVLPSFCYYTGGSGRQSVTSH